MRLAILQPYFFPYTGYFQLVKAVGKFIFYDDVNYINRGWINRNRILINGEAHYITVHQKDASQNKLINEIEILDNREKIKKTILNAYKKAPYFNEAWHVLEKILEFDTNSISRLAAYSIEQVCNYLGIETNFEFSSEKYTHTSALKSANRLIAICKINNVSDYINPIGGMNLYHKEDFKTEGINLFFLKSKSIVYNQFNNPFVENLSIIDIMMFNSKDDITLILNNYDLI